MDRDRSSPQRRPKESDNDLSRSKGCRLTARYVFPGDGPPVEHGTVEITDGVVTAIHDRRDATARDLGNAAIIPGLVNAHTHLEFSDLTTPIAPPVPFGDWIRGVVAHRRNRTETVESIVQRGLEESVRAGTTCVGEIATADESSDAIVGFRFKTGNDSWQKLPASAEATEAGSFCYVVYRELLGFAPENVEPQLAVARSYLDGQLPGRRVRFGLSPHAPYSVHPDLFAKLCALAAERKVPVAVHVAETREELEFLDRGTGPLAEMLRVFGAWRDGVVQAGTRAMDYLHLLNDAPRVAVVHGNYLADDELDFVSRRKNVSLVVCPRTHAYFRHAPHPWRTVQERGGNVAIGTDSRASNPDLSVWEELRFLRRLHRDVSDVELLRLGTVNAAAALGVEDSVGSLHPGRTASLAVVELHSSGGLFDSGNRIANVMLDGDWLPKSA